MHWSQRWLCRKIGESLSFPKMYYSIPINMFFIVKNHWQPYFTDNPRRTHNISETGSVSVFRRGTYSVGSLEVSSTNRVCVSLPSPEDQNGSSFQKVLFSRY
jgi:hypothetical protein